MAILKGFPLFSFPKHKKIYAMMKKNTRRTNYKWRAE
uniref:Uncharacterized protein n=1 Tax=Rhizophora mucronata TaxID=61149 RepID=A0A2P2N9Q3_RHIMU